MKMKETLEEKETGAQDNRGNTPPASRKCFVCEDSGSKYKCPQCYVKYCSVKCYKTHKETCGRVPDHGSYKDFVSVPDHGSCKDSIRVPDHGSYTDSVSVKPQSFNEMDGIEGDVQSYSEINGEKRGVCLGETEDRVPLELLQNLEKSPQILAMLGNRHLRAMMENLCNSEDSSKDVAMAMQEPIFTEFADQCLKIVDGDSG